jgi:hypothetical protein
MAYRKKSARTRSYKFGRSRRNRSSASPSARRVAASAERQKASSD